MRKCSKEDFAEMGQEDDFIQRTKLANNYYCPDGNYKGIKLRLQ